MFEYDARLLNLHDPNGIMNQLHWLSQLMLPAGTISPNYREPKQHFGNINVPLWEYEPSGHLLDLFMAELYAFLSPDENNKINHKYLTMLSQVESCIVCTIPIEAFAVLTSEFPGGYTVFCANEGLYTEVQGPAQQSSCWFKWTCFSCDWTQ